MGEGWGAREFQWGTSGEATGEGCAATKPALLKCKEGPSFPALISLLSPSSSQGFYCVSDPSRVPEEMWGQHIFPKGVCPWAGSSATMGHF